MILTNWLGELAALSFAGLWGIASVVYGYLGRYIPPREVNLVTGGIALALLTFTIFISGVQWLPTTTTTICLLFLSGAIAIGLGDTAFFATVNHLGASRALLMTSLYSPMTIIGAMLFLDERLDITEWCGIFLIILAVTWVVTEQAHKTVENTSSAHLWQGVFFAITSVVTNVSGTLLSSAAFSNSNIEPLWAALLRLSSGMFLLLGWRWFTTGNGNYKQNNQNLWLRSLLTKRLMIVAIVVASFCVYLGIVMQQTAIKFEKAGIASTLMETDTLFTVGISVLMGYEVSRREFTGILIAVFGIALINLK